MASDGSNPYGECESGHQVFRGGCPDCAADMVSEAALTGISAANETHIWTTDDKELRDGTQK
jgi:hypothetical protein